MSADHGPLLRDAYGRVSRGATRLGVIRFRDGKVATITALSGRDEARCAAGLG